MPKQTNKSIKKPIKSVASRVAVKSRVTKNDGPYLLKLTLFALLGLLWVKISKSGSELSVPIPIGFIIGLVFTAHEHFQIDRKIEYAVLLAALLVGFIAPFGLFINF